MKQRFHLNFSAKNKRLRVQLFLTGKFCFWIFAHLNFWNDETFLAYFHTSWLTKKNFRHFLRLHFFVMRTIFKTSVGFVLLRKPISADKRGFVQISTAEQFHVCRTSTMNKIEISVTYVLCTLPKSEVTVPKVHFSSKM